MVAEKGELTGLNKAAVLLLSLDQDVIGEIFRHLDERDVRSLSLQMAKINMIPRRVAENVVQEFRDLLTGKGEYLPVSENNIFEILRKTFGPEKAKNILQEMHFKDEGDLLESLRTLNPFTITSLLRGEHPQTLAIILSQFDPAFASEILNLLPEHVHSEVILRIAKLDRVSPEVVKEVLETLQEQIKTYHLMQSSAMGGVKSAAEILNFVDKGLEASILNSVSEVDPSLADEIRQSMFIFSDFTEVDDRAMMTILRNVSNDDLALALKGASSELQQKILKNVSERAAEMILEDMEAMGAVKIKDVEKAQQSIIAIARELEEKGEISLGRGEEELVV